MLLNEIILAISKRDYLKPLGIYSMFFGNSVHDTKYHKWCIGTGTANFGGDYGAEFGKFFKP